MLHIYNFIRHIGNHKQQKKEAVNSKQYDENSKHANIHLALAKVSSIVFIF